jgi:hypothetical protein
MELTVAERLTLLNGLPKQGDITTIKIIRQLREKLSFTELEHARYNFRQDGDLLKWDNGNEAAEISDIGNKAKSIIVGVLQAADKEGTLTEEHISLWDKFVET